MNKQLNSLFLALILIIPIIAKADEITDRTLSEWINDAENILRGNTSVAVLSMAIHKAEYDREFDLLLMTDDRDNADKFMIRMLGPAVWRGNVTLKVKDRITFFEPRNKRTTVMGSSMLTSSWMGSHFTNDDLMRETDLAKHYQYKLLKSWKENEQSHYSIELLPKPTSPVSWGKVHYHLYLNDEGRVFPAQLQYFKRAEDEMEVRTLSYGNVQEMNGLLIPTNLKMTLRDKPAESTQMHYKKIRFNMDIDPSKFSERVFN